MEHPQSSLGAIRDAVHNRLSLRLGTLHAVARRWLWWRVVERTFARADDDNVSLLAAGVTFFVFLAIPAMFSGLISLYGLGLDPADVETQVHNLRGLVPETALAVLEEQSQRVVTASIPTLSFGLAFSVIIAVWGGRSAMMALIAALNLAFDARERRSFLAVQGIALGLTLFVILFAVAALILVVVVPVALTLIPLGSFDKAVGTLIQWALLIILDVLLMAVFYRFGPSNDVRCSWLSTGGVMAALLWLMASALFSLYVAASARYNQVYGSIGGVVVLLTWLYLSFYVILLGAELNSAIAAERKDAANTAQEIPGRRSARED